MAAGRSRGAWTLPGEADTARTPPWALGPQRSFLSPFSHPGNGTVGLGRGGSRDSAVSGISGCLPPNIGTYGTWHAVDPALPECKHLRRTTPCPDPTSEFVHFYFLKRRDWREGLGLSLRVERQPRAPEQLGKIFEQSKVKGITTKNPSEKTGSMEGMVEMTQTKTMILDQKKRKKKRKENPGLITTHFILLSPHRVLSPPPLPHPSGVGGRAGQIGWEESGAGMGPMP